MPEPVVMPTVAVFGLQVGLPISYLWCSSSELAYENENDAYLAHPDGRRARIEWGGFRVGIAVGYPLP